MSGENIDMEENLSENNDVVNVGTGNVDPHKKAQYWEGSGLFFSFMKVSLQLRDNDTIFKGV